MPRHHRTLQRKRTSIENISYPLPLKSNIRKGKGHNKIKKTIFLNFFALLFIVLLLKGLGIWTNNWTDNYGLFDKGIKLEMGINPEESNVLLDSSP